MTDRRKLRKRDGLLRSESALHQQSLHPTGGPMTSIWTNLRPHVICAAVAISSSVGPAGCASDRHPGWLPQPDGASADATSPSDSGSPDSEATIPSIFESEHGRFELLWREDFNAAVPGWNTANWSWDDNLAWLSSDMVRIAGGLLQLGLENAQGAAPSGKPYWGGEYYTQERYQYGRFVTRARLPVPSGVVASFFLLQINRADDGSTTDLSEIDIEFAGSSRKIQFTAHWIDANATQRMDPHTFDLDFDGSQEFHEYVIEWTPSVIAYFVDGKQLFAATNPAVLSEINQPLSVHMNYWISPSVPWVGAFNPGLLPLTAEYDFVAYYRFVP